MRSHPLRQVAGRLCELPRSMEITLPKSSLEETGGSLCRNRSPRAIRNEPSGLSVRPTTRCANIRPSRTYNTISPLEISDITAR